jgi:hypothetical protein
MRASVLARFLLILALISLSRPAAADSPSFHRIAHGNGESSAASPASASGLPEWAQCLAAAAAAGQAAGIPAHLMESIAVVESGRRDMQGRVFPWPWSINVEGIDHVFASKAEAIAAVTQLQAQGVRSIDIGCLQVNLFYHPTAFATLDAAFDPAANARYAAAFLGRLFVRTGSWGAATASYHSATPDLGRAYAARVGEVFAGRLRGAGADPTAMAATMQLVRFAPGANMGSAWSASSWQGPGWTSRSTAHAAPNRYRLMETRRASHLSVALEGALTQFAEHRIVAAAALPEPGLGVLAAFH